METYRNMKIPLKYSPSEITDQCSIKNIAFNWYVHVEISKGVYGFKGVGIISFKGLVHTLEPHVYHPGKDILDLWTQKIRNIHFILAVDNFGIKYFDIEDAQ